MITVIEISPKSYIDFEAFAEECGKMVKRKQKNQPIIIREIFPNGMTREEYQAELRKHARYIAMLFLRIYPDVLSNDEERETA